MAHVWQKVTQALREHRLSYPANASWTALFEQEGVGFRQGKVWVLNDSELALLRRRVTQETGVDPLSDQLPADRMNQAALGGDEKQSRTGVFARQVILARRSGPLPVKSDRAVYTPPGSMLAIPVEHIVDQPDIKWIIVENGEAIQHWHLGRLPEDWQDAVWCYRGHGSNAAAVSRLISQIPAHRIAHFYDADPAGFAMAWRQIGNIVVPADLLSWRIETPFIAKVNNNDAFYRQFAAHRIPADNDDNPLIPLWLHCITNRLAIMQEHILAHHIDLAVIKK